MQGCVLIRFICQPPAISESAVSMKLRLIRNATLQLEYAGQYLLVDPMFGAPGAYPALTVGPTSRRNPLVPLPCPVEALLQPAPAAVLLTHTHFDHFDPVAAASLPKSLPILGQPADQANLSRRGFTAFQGIETALDWHGIHLTRTGGKHGKGIIGTAMGRVSGFVLKASGEPTLYIVGDTIWHPAVAATITTHQPDVIVLNTGAAQFNIGAPITMGIPDVLAVCHAAPSARVIAVHLEAVNHGRLTRRALHEALAAAGLAAQVAIPADGAVVDV